MSNSDGKVVIDTALSTDGIKKDLQTVSKTVEKEMQTATKSIDNINKSVNKVKFDNIGKQLDSVSKAIDNTNSKIELQKKKLAELKKSFESATDVKAKNKMQEQILNTEASIIKLESRITSLNAKEMKLKVDKNALNGLDGDFKSASMSAVKSLDDIEKKSEKTGNAIRKNMGSLSIGEGIVKVGNNISSVGDKLTTRVTLPIIGIGTAAVKMEMEAESSFAKVSTVMDQSAMSAEQLKKSVVDASNKSGVAVTDFNEALYETLSAGVESGKAIEFTSNMAKLAKGGFTETTKAVDVVTSVLNAYGLSADEATNISDKLITTQNIGKTTVDQLAGSLGRVIPTANAFGVNIDNVATAMSQLTKNGIQSAEATTYYNSMLNELGSSGTVADKALRELNGKGFTQLIKEGKQLPEILKMLQDYATQNGKSLNDMFGNMEGAKSALTIMKDGGTEYTEILGEMENSTGATQKAFDKMNNTDLEKSKKAFNELKNAGIELGQELIPIATEIIGEIKELAEKFEKLSPSQQESIVKFGLFSAATGPVLKGVGALTSGVGGLVKLFSKLSPILGTATAATEGIAEAGVVAAGTGGLGALTLAAAPYILAAAAIGAAGYSIYEGLNEEVIPQVDLFADKITTVGNTVQTQYGAMTEVVGTNTTKISDATKQAVQSYLDMDNGAKEAIQDLYINNATITDQIATDTTVKFDGMATAIVGGYEKQKTDSITQLTDMFAQEQGLTAEEQSSILEKTNQYYTDKENATKDNEAKINAIIKSAKDNNTSLTADQVQEISALQNGMRDTAINVLSQQETEAAVILQRMKDYDGQITAEQASEHIKTLNDSRDKAVETANDEYEKKIATITKMRDETGSITAEQAEIMLENAKKQRDDTVTKAEETRDGAVSKIKEMNTSIEESVSLSSGKVKTYWDKLVEWWDSWNPPNKTFTYEIAGGSTVIDKGISNMYDPYPNITKNKYTGTNGGDEGLSYVNEISHGGWELNSGADEIAMLGSGSKITPHMTSVNEMNQEISTQIGTTLTPIMKVLTNVLGQVANNTGAIKTYTKETASNIIDSMNSTGGTFGTLQSQLDNANYEKDKVSSMSVEDNQAYINAKAEVDRISDMTSDAKKALGEEQLKIQKDNAEKSLDIAKKTAELDIIIAKQNADEKVRIAEANKDKLIKLSEAVTNALKSQLEKEKAVAEKIINDELDAMSKSYDRKIDKIEAKLKSDTSKIDDKIAELEQQSTDTNREDIRSESSNNINMLRTKMANTKSQADKDALALQIKDAQKTMSTQENEWNIEDEKAKLEEKKALLSEEAQAKKDNLKAEYEDQKAIEEAKLKSTDEYYNKLLETDSLNAQARYTMLTESSDQLVALLNSYAPGWQNAGQSLADSLLTGLNTSKQNVQDAVDEMISLRGTPNTTMSGYATGTSYNSTSGLYKVDERGFETTTNGSVAYVTKGAAIKNNMQSEAYIDSRIASQVAAMKNSILSSQADMMNQVLGSISNTTNNKVTHNDNGLTFKIENLNNYSSKDTEQMMNEAEALRQRNKKA